jgi:fatty acid desaturase
MDMNLPVPEDLDRRLDELERFQERRATVMNVLLIVVAVLAALFLLGGGLVPSLNFLIWVGVVLLILAAVGFFMGRRRT